MLRSHMHPHASMASHVLSSSFYCSTAILSKASLTHLTSTWALTKKAHAPLIARHFSALIDSTLPPEVQSSVQLQPVPNHSDPFERIPFLSTADSIKLRNHFDVLLDVREVEEYKDDNIKGSTLIPLNDVLLNPVEALKKEFRDKQRPMPQTLLVHCRSGIRSAKATFALRNSGFDAVNVAGGILGWREEEKKGSK
jgi:phage shock protein E